MRIHDLIAAVLLLAAGLGAGLLALQARLPAPRIGEVGLHHEPFLLQRPAGEPMLVTPDAWLELPMLRGDLDLIAQVELGEGAELDLVVRRVEARPIQGLNLGFHGRFATLRLSTAGQGPAWRSPAEALFGEPHGQRLGAGLPATVSLQARGRRLRANVAGRELPEFLAQDDYGSIALIARGGPVAVQSLQITPRNGGVDRSPLWLSLACGVALALLALWRRSGAPRAVAAAVVLVSGPALFVWTMAMLPPLAQPELLDERLASVLGAPLAVACLLPRRAATVLMPLSLMVLLVGQLQWVAKVQQRFAPAPQLDEYFGPLSRETLVETLACRVRGPRSIHTLAGVGPRVVLLGGQLLYRRGAAPDQHIEPLLEGLLRAESPESEAIALPTEDGWSGQQWRFFDRFLQAFAPSALVFGVPRDEGVAEREGAAPRSTPEALAQTLDLATAYCEARGCGLVLLADEGLPDEFLAVLRSRVGARRPLVQITGTDSALGAAQKLAAALAPLLRR